MVASSSTAAVDVGGQLIYGVKVSSVGPGQVSGQDRVHERSALDLAMKLHYLRSVYFFRGADSLRGLAPVSFKEPMFTMLNIFYVPCGRLRRSDSGRTFIKCNDCGIRFLEAYSAKTLDEWLHMSDPSLDRLLVPNQPIGPDLMFSPLVLIQVTSFRCGGISVGLSWAHVLGDPHSAGHFMNMFGQFMSGTFESNGPTYVLESHSSVDKSPNPKPLFSSREPLSLKQIDPVGDYWMFGNDCKMEAVTFHVGPEQLTKLQSITSGPNKTGPSPLFECLCAIIWQCMARIRERDQQPTTVTVCKAGARGRKNGVASNSQSITTVQSDIPVASADPGDLVALLVGRAVDEKSDIGAAVEASGGLSDFVVYGANLTFLDLQEAGFYDFELKGQKPIHLSCAIDGIGNNGVVLLLPGSAKDFRDGFGGCCQGRTVTVKLPKDEGLKLKNELERALSNA